MNIRFFIMIIVYSYASFLLSYPISDNYITYNDKITVLNTIESKNCFITYVLINGKNYIVKQKKRPEKQLSVVRDALAAYIAEGFNIAHLVDIVSYKKRLAGKIHSDWPAIILTIAPGDTVRRQRDTVYNKLRLRQWWANAPADQEKGLTKDIITYMTWHKQLPLIVALDLFIGNSDRHCGNLCYEPETDSFCAIDMDDTFNKDLCALACENLLLMIQKDKVSFSKKEKIALNNVRKCLRYFVIHHKPQELIKKLHIFASQAGFVPGAKIYNKDVQKKLSMYEQMIVKTHTSACELIVLLGEIVAKR